MKYYHDLFLFPCDIWIYFLSILNRYITNSQIIFRQLNWDPSSPNQNVPEITLSTIVSVKRQGWVYQSPNNFEKNFRILNYFWYLQTFNVSKKVANLTLHSSRFLTFFYILSWVIKTNNTENYAIFANFWTY